MKIEIENPELLELPPLQEFSSIAPPTTGTVDDDDEREDERPDENEAPIRETSDKTEAPEEFEPAADVLPQPEDNAANEEEG